MRIMARRPGYTVVEATPLPGYEVRLRFADGLSGIADLYWVTERGGVFEPLRDPEYFRDAMKVDLGTVTWPSGADIAPEVLHEAVRKARHPTPPALTWKQKDSGIRRVLDDASGSAHVVRNALLRMMRDMQRH